MSGAGTVALTASPLVAKDRCLVSWKTAVLAVTVRRSGVSVVWCVDAEHPKGRTVLVLMLLGLSSVSSFQTLGLGL